MAEGKLSIFYDRDAEPARLKAKTIAIVGYGSQGHAHALNLKDGGYKVAVGLRPGSASRAKAEGAGLSVMDTAEAAPRRRTSRRSGTARRSDSRTRLPTSNCRGSA